MSLLEQPKELDKIALLRKKLIGTDRPDHVAIIDEKEHRIKDLLIKVSLLKHEGITMLLDMARSQIKDINHELIEADPKSFAPEHVMDYARTRARLMDRKELWAGFISFFGNAEDDLRTENAELDFQLVEDDIPSESE